jgi:hypothetical protein
MVKVEAQGGLLVIVKLLGQVKIEMQAGLLLLLLLLLR